MKASSTETSLVQPVARFLQGRGFTRVRPELQFYDYSIDLYAYSPTRLTTMAIELKLTKWQRAIEQAILYRLCSDFSFIALPDRYAHRVDTALLRTCGIGLLAVSVRNGECTEVVAPTRSDLLLRRYKDRLRRVLTAEV